MLRPVFTRNPRRLSQLDRASEESYGPVLSTSALTGIVPFQAGAQVRGGADVAAVGMLQTPEDVHAGIFRKVRFADARPLRPSGYGAAAFARFAQNLGRLAEPSAREANEGWWGRQDSNLRRLSQRIYSPPPLPLGTLPR